MARRRRGLPIDGVLLLDKPKGMSSNYALQKARRLYQAQKAGHTGTLDPMATGLLPVCFGEATKFSSHLLEADKVYRARIKFGQVTDTGDAEGTVIREREIPEIAQAELDAVLDRFRGEIDQVPPMYSALKHQGRPLYELARQGIEIERAVRRVTIYNMALLARHSDGIEIEVAVSKGTYIRSLAEDIGEALGCGAHLTALRRLKTGPFTGDAMLDFERLEALADQQAREGVLLPVDILLDHLPCLDITAEMARMILRGQQAETTTGSLEVDSLARVYQDQQLLGLVRIAAEGVIAPRRLLSSAVEAAAG
ncbi:pseudouridine synthase [Cobetia amphilecti]|jgi:tRNA pseudouridine55 synthase|uniref:tRNA pseudouridine(55) synthase TruB n=1 Tax=Cobetia TaxID=204286 RepID=UPI0005027109|nr:MULTISPECIES: tRNA pseudouridine(55) synthase TruB [Cobetia]KGA02421.1 pseudouridine synthase [Cobetia amphilecti]MBF08337.1 tRNA pseudouridine(55) synthase TruB [Cobetia sp.]UBU48879.1 tRNA pseudouridine(55) synthase TruB [Cobetia amphilecti]HAR07960.1 tRNA pseudouridine(55) synthase TruB [Cobetia sp.]HBJ27650.1 tRNA pseudouridine(55) synthase TruB [Cobetia sp.]|tara:strand:+ start:36402 stop:37331 length:930 start_codon:yes stop_codon:yes gene_type:complete